MKKLSWLLLAMILTVGSAAAYRDDCCNPCDDYCNPCCGIDATVYADYLYWKVCRSDLDYSLNDAETRYVKPGYDSGWRIGGRISRCEWDLGVRYTSFNTKETVDLFPPLSEGNFATYSIDWDVVDIEVGYTLSLNCDRALLRPFAGAKLAWIDEHLDRFIVATTEQHKLEFDGYGLLVGLEGLFELYQANFCNQCIPLSVYIRGSWAILDGHFDNEELVLPSEERNFFRDECLYVPVLEAFAGLHIGGTECWCVTPYLLIGYEVQHWGSWREFADEDDIAGLGIGGLVVRLGLDY